METDTLDTLGEKYATALTDLDALRERLHDAIRKEREDHGTTLLQLAVRSRCSLDTIQAVLNPALRAKLNKRRRATNAARRDQPNP
jgi:hypothetical protein